MKYYLLIFLGLQTALCAQTGTLPPPSNPTSELAANAQWQKLIASGRPPTASTRDKNNTRAEQAAKHVEAADRFKSFYITYPTHRSAKEAKAREVIALALAALNGDAAHDHRRESLLDEIRQDTSIPIARRFEAVAWSGRAAAKQQGQLDRAAKLAAEERLTRDLIKEFPSHPVGYESLVAIARDSNPEHGKSIAQDILAMSAVSLEAKDGARRILEREALVGKSAPAIFSASGASTLFPAATGKITIVYSWSPSMPQFRLLAKQLAKQAPQAAFIGVCLDGTLKQGGEGKTFNLPGEHYYYPHGAASPLAEALAIGSEAVIYVIDRQGIIRDVQGYIDLAEKIGRIGK
jgi:hypothetical protein